MVPDLDIFDSIFPYVDRKIKFQIETVGDARIHEVGELLTELKKISNQHLLIVLNWRWFAVLQTSGAIYIYNCHPSQIRKGSPYNGNDPSAIVRVQSKQQLEQVLLHFGQIKPGYKGWCAIHSIQMTMMKNV